jgi:RND superfamily putative drug exporter
VGDDRDRTVFSDIELHINENEVVGLYGAGPSGKSALLFTIAGRVSRLEGDLKVLGRVLPSHAHAVRTRVALISCRDTETAAEEARAALADGIGLILLDDLDTVVNPMQRDLFRELLGRSPATFVFTCQNPELLRDVLPPTTRTVAMAQQLEVVV